MLHKFLLPFFLLLLSTHLGYACFNEYRARLTGEFVLVDSYGVAVPRAYHDDRSKIRRLHEADSIYQLTGTMEAYSDWGMMMAFNGEYLKAKQVFLEIEQKSPGLYNTAANLGTTYELLGQNDSALIWINKALQINPGSHNGSEWIHVKILEAKIAANGDPNYLWTHSILGLDFGDEKSPENKNNLDLGQLREQLYHQLSERMSFIKPQDPVVAQLLFDLGNTCAMVVEVKSGLLILEAAKQYGLSSDILDKRMAYFKSLQAKADISNKIEHWARDYPTAFLALLGLFFVGVVLGLRYWYLGRRG